MIDPQDANAKADALADLLRQKLGLRGATLSAKLSKARPVLPRRVQKAGQIVVTAQRDAAHPRLAMMADPGPVEAAYAEITAHLKQIDPLERRKTRLLRWLGGLVFNLIVMAVLLVLWLRWQGFA